MKKQTCVRCKKIITGKISIETRRRKLGKKSINEVDFYCGPCFLKRNEEKSWNECKKKGISKRKNNKRK